MTDRREGATAYVSADKIVEDGEATASAIRDWGGHATLVQLVDGSDRETIQLLADEVVPAMQG